jgi:hypothetical protein
MTTQKSKFRAQVPSFKVGERVKILNFANVRGLIVEMRGPLGPGGSQIYRVRFGEKRRPMFIEVRQDQLEPLASNGRNGTRTHSKSK